jgi:hypothetical protein
MQTKQLAEMVSALMASQDGFTITADGKPLQRGYVVGGLVRRDGDALAKLKQPTSAADYQELTNTTAELIEQHRELIEQGAALGGWRQGNTISLDLVTIHESGRQAAKVARQRDQIALGIIEGYRYAGEVTL